jgi:hypothetical protein
MPPLTRVASPGDPRAHGRVGLVTGSVSQCRLDGLAWKAGLFRGPVQSRHPLACEARRERLATRRSAMRHYVSPGAAIHQHSAPSLASLPHVFDRYNCSRLANHTEGRQFRPDGGSNIARGEVRVMLLDHARVNVTELSRDHTHGRSGHCQVRGVCVPEHVKRGRRRDARGLARVGYGALLMGGAPGVAIIAQEDACFLGVARRPACKQPASVLRQDNVARLATLGLPNRQRASLLVEVGACEAG